MFFENFSYIYSWGLDFIRAVQSVASPALTAVVKAITFLGNPEFCIVLIVVLAWCIDEKKAFRLSLLMGLSTGLNYVMKSALKVPRPYEVDPSVMLMTESDFSTPSGHAQNSAILWPFLMKNINALQKKKFNALKLVIAFALPLLIGFSRVYLGVHYPSDVLAGWAIGFLFVLCEFVLGARIAKAFEKLQHHSLKVLICFLPCFLLLCINNQQIKMPAFIFGLAVGRIYITEKGGFSAKNGKLYQKVLRILVGAAIAGAVFYMLNFAREFEQIERYAKFVQYCFLGWWLTFGAPVVFDMLHLAVKPEQAAAESTAQPAEAAESAQHAEAANSAEKEGADDK